VPFEYRYAHNDRRVVNEERHDTVRDRSLRVVVAVDGVFSDVEMQSILGDATAARLHPVEPPVAWVRVTIGAPNCLIGTRRGLAHPSRTRAQNARHSL
jgi:hypothetical protein